MRGQVGGMALYSMRGRTGGLGSDETRAGRAAWAGLDETRVGSDRGSDWRGTGLN